MEMLHHARIQKLDDFIRGGPTLTTFFLFCFYEVWGIEFRNTTITGHQRPDSETQFKWRFACVLMMAH